jgi:hypothetical protein
MNGKFAQLIVATSLAASLAACGGEAGLGGFLAAPDKYVLYSCPQLDIAVAATEARQKELEGLMQKAGTGADGQVVSAIAYQPEYTSLRGDMVQLRRYKAEKDCKPPAAAAKPATPAAPAKPKGKGKAG